MNKIEKIIELLEAIVKNTTNTDKSASDADILIKSKDEEINKILSEKGELEKNLNFKIETLKTDLQNKDNEILKLKKEMYGLNKKIEELNSDLQAENDKFKKAKEIFNEFNMLDSDIRDRLKGIFRGEGVENFVYCGVQDIENLWDNFKDELSKEPNENQTKYLNNIFDFFLEAYNQTEETPLYSIDNGDYNTFIEDKMTRTKNGPIRGDVDTIYFRGLVNNRNNKLIKKTLIKIKG